MEVTTEVAGDLPYVGMPDAESLVEGTFAALGGGRCRVEQLCCCLNREIRNGLLASGIASGMRASIDALEQVAVELAAGADRA